MKKNIENKSKIIQDIKILTENSILTMIVDYSKIKSLEIKYIRRALSEKNITAKVYKNTLAKKAIENTSNDILTKNFSGQMLTIFSKTDIISPIKILNNFRKQYTNLKIKVICIDGKLFFEKNIKELINLPTKKDAIIILNIYIKLPILNIMRNLKYPYLKLLTLINLISENKKGEHNVNEN